MHDECLSGCGAVCLCCLCRCRCAHVVCPVSSEVFWLFRLTNDYCSSSFANIRMLSAFFSQSAFVFLDCNVDHRSDGIAFSFAACESASDARTPSDAQRIIVVFIFETGPCKPALLFLQYSSRRFYACNAHSKWKCLAPSFSLLLFLSDCSHKTYEKCTTVSLRFGLDKN